MSSIDSPTRLLEEIDALRERIRHLAEEAQDTGRLSTEFLMLREQLQRRYDELGSILQPPGSA